MAPCGKSTPRPGAVWAAPRQATGWHVPSPLPAGLGRGRQHVLTMSRTSNATLERSLGSQVSGGTRFGVLPRSQRAVTPATRRGWVPTTAKSPHPADICKGQLQNRRRPRPEVSHRAPQRRVMSTGIARRTEEPEGTQSGRPAPSPGPRAPAPPGTVTALGTGPPATEPGHRGGRRPAERGGVSSVRARGVWSGVG